MRPTHNPFQHSHRPRITLLLLVGLLFNWLVLPLGASNFIEQTAHDGIAALSSQFYCSSGASSGSSKTAPHHCPKCDCCHQLGQFYVAPKINLGIAQRQKIRFFTKLKTQIFPRPLSAPLSRGPPTLV